MAVLPPLPGAVKSAAALAADAAARVAAAAWAEAHAKARRAAALVAAAAPVPVGGSLRSAATAPCEIGGSWRRGGSGSFGSGSPLSPVVGGSLKGIGKAPRVTKRVGASAAKQQRAAAVAGAAAAARAAAARAAAADAAAAGAQASSLYYGYGELSASQHDVLVRNAENKINGGDFVGSSSHQLQQRLRHQQEHVLVGTRVAVHSPRDGAFFRATVRDVGSAAGAATGRGLPPGAALLVYDDGKAEVAHLGSRRFRLLAPRAASAGCGAGLLAAASAAGAEGLRLDADCAPAPFGADPPAGPESARRGAALLLRSPAAVCGSDDGGGGADRFELGNYLSSSLPSSLSLPLSAASSSAWCRADVVGVDRAARRVRVLYADGEDEWIDLAAESARGAARVAPLGALWPPLAPGLAAGAPRPGGCAAVGWRVALYCSREAAFFAADVRGFDARTGLHSLAYADGSGAVEDARLDAEAVKWVSAPPPPPTGAASAPCAAATAAAMLPASGGLDSPPHPHSPAVPTAALLPPPPSPDACRAGSSSFSADGGSENADEANRASNTNLAAYGSMGSVSCDAAAAAAAVAALAASQRGAVAAAAAAAAAAAVAAANASWEDPMDADGVDPWSAAAVAVAAASGGGGAAAGAAARAPACWWKADGASAAAGVARLTLGADEGAARLLPSAAAAEEDGDSKASAVSGGGAGRGGSSAPPTPTNALADAVAAAPAARLESSSFEEGTVHGSVAATLAADRHTDFHDDGACGALVGCGGAATAAVAALAFDSFLVGGSGGDLLDASALGW